MDRLVRTKLLEKRVSFSGISSMSVTLLALFPPAFHITAPGVLAYFF